MREQAVHLTEARIFQVLTPRGEASGHTEGQQGYRGPGRDQIRAAVEMKSGGWGGSRSVPRAKPTLSCWSLCTTKNH